MIKPRKRKFLDPDEEDDVRVDISRPIRIGEQVFHKRVQCGQSAKDVEEFRGYKKFLSKTLKDEAKYRPNFDFIRDHLSSNNGKSPRKSSEQMIFSPLLEENLILLYYLQDKHRNIAQVCLPTRLTLGTLREEDFGVTWHSIKHGKSNNVGKLLLPPNLRQMIETSSSAKNKRFVIISLDLTTNDRRIMDCDSSHANILIYDSKLKTLERFDPYGEWKEFNCLLLDDKLKKLFCSWMSGLSSYLSAGKISPLFGLQTIAELDKEQGGEGSKIGDPYGFCLAWCTLYADARLSNPDIPPSVLINLLLIELQRSINVGMMQFIRSYANFTLAQGTDLLRKTPLIGSSNVLNHLYKIVHPRMQARGYESVMSNKIANENSTSEKIRVSSGGGDSNMVDIRRSRSRIKFIDGNEWSKLWWLNYHDELTSKDHTSIDPLIAGVTYPDHDDDGDSDEDGDDEDDSAKYSSSYGRCYQIRSDDDAHKVYAKIKEFEEETKKNEILYIILLGDGKRYDLPSELEILLSVKVERHYLLMDCHSVSYMLMKIFSLGMDDAIVIADLSDDVKRSIFAPLEKLASPYIGDDGDDAEVRINPDSFKKVLKKINGYLSNVKYVLDEQRFNAAKKFLEQEVWQRHYSNLIDYSEEKSSYYSEQAKIVSSKYGFAVVDTDKKFENLVDGVESL